MTDPSECAAILLAAGQSSRFGAADKLLAPWGTDRLAERAAIALNAAGFGRRIAVVQEAAPEVAERLSALGFELVVNGDPGAGLSRSIQLGIDAIEGASAAVIALADMPRVPAGHFVQLAAAVSGKTPIAATQGAHGPMVPAAFDRSMFARLRSLSGDTGARALLQTAPTISIDLELLIDIDRPDQLR